jgi:NAD(P)-dependent dehydrogenase (short-subunit alcohol dehydrogenase family)
MAQRVVVVSGAASGIGLAIASSFRDLGDIVHLIDISRPRLEEATASWDLNVGEAFHLHDVDVSDYDKFRAVLIAAAEQGAGNVDVMVNNAGVFDGYCNILETTPDLWDRVLGINLTGTFYGCKAAAELMIEARQGRIINVGSVAAARSSADGLSYVASKAGMVGLTKRLAVDVGPYGVTANVICPGTIATGIRANSEEILGSIVDMNRGVSATFTQELKDYLIPAHRPGSADEVASLAIYLASEPAAYVNGQVMYVDGGWTAT